MAKSQKTKKVKSLTEFEKVSEAKRYLCKKLPLSRMKPVIGITLGSGLGYMVELLKGAKSFSYGDIPHCSKSSAPDHAGRLWFG